MKHFRPTSFFLASLLSAVVAYTVPDSNGAPTRDAGSNRRAFLSRVVGTALGSSAVLAVQPRALAAAGGDEAVYFGAGCFWHVQHEVRDVFY